MGHPVQRGATQFLPDGVASARADPLGDRLVLAKFLRQLQLNL